MLYWICKDISWSWWWPKRRVYCSVLWWFASMCYCEYLLLKKKNCLVLIFVSLFVRWAQLIFLSCVLLCFYIQGNFTSSYLFFIISLSLVTFCVHLSRVSFLPLIWSSPLNYAILKSFISNFLELPSYHLLFNDRTTVKMSILKIFLLKLS